jgi:hypothetical protein
MTACRESIAVQNLSILAAHAYPLPNAYVTLKNAFQNSTLTLRRSFHYFKVIIGPQRNAFQNISFKYVKVMETYQITQG